LDFTIVYFFLVDGCLVETT